MNDIEFLVLGLLIPVLALGVAYWLTWGDGKGQSLKK